MPGLAQGPVVEKALEDEGIRFAAWRWRWLPGAKGGTFPPHLRRDQSVVFNRDGWVGDNAEEWGALPGEGVNFKHCRCTLRMLLRGADGRFQPEGDVAEEWDE